MILCYRYRLLPTKRQHGALESVLESQRQLYNAALEERVDAYRKAGLVRTYFDQSKGLTEWRKTDPEASGYPVNLQRATLKRLDGAYRGFFRRLKLGQKPGLPRFRGKGRFDSFGFSEFSGIRLTGSRLRFKGMPGSLRVHFHRELPGGTPIRSCTIKRGGKCWSVAFAVEITAANPRHQERAVGVDLGISTFAAFSDGGFIPSLRSARRAERRVRVAQRALARKKRGSRGQRLARRHVARCYREIACRRTESLHQASARLVRDYDVLAIERLNIIGLARGPLAKDIYDAGWRRFISMLRYKAAKAGVRLIEVNPRNTSQDCSACGWHVSKTLGERQHECARCGLSIDRDLNAARNVLNRAGFGPGLLNVADAACVQAKTLFWRRDFV